MTIGQPSDAAPMNLESGRSIEWVSVSFADAPRGLNLVDATGVALCLELGLPFI
jgi:hypothetical protein